MTNEKDYTDSDFIVSEEDIINNIRIHRDYLLKTEVDPIATNPLRWNALSNDEQNALLEYRQKLLDMPAQNLEEGVEFPDLPSWKKAALTEMYGDN